jgi:pimeloyl-ACP methyl ester carboxylesterase
MAHNDVPSLIGALQSLWLLARPLDREPGLPIVIAAGGNDPFDPASHDLARRWRTARLVEIPAANHVSILAEPELLAVMRQTVSQPSDRRRLPPVRPAVKR